MDKSQFLNPTIYQTWKNKDDEVALGDSVSSFKTSGFNHVLVDDSEMDIFVKEKLSAEDFQYYLELPLIVMKADLWRILVIYENGGIYADVDCALAVPFNSWEALGNVMVTEDNTLLIGKEKSHWICNWFFAATKPHHPVLKEILDEILRRIKNINYLNIHFVHNTTGPSVVTDIIRKKLDLNFTGDYAKGNDSTIVLNSMFVGRKNSEYIKHFNKGSSWQYKRFVVWLDHNSLLFVGMFAILVISLIAPWLFL